MSDLHHHTRRPQGELRRFVREIVWVHSERPRHQVLLPEAALTCGLWQSGSASLQQKSLPHAVLSGMQQKVRVIEHGANSSFAIVRFTPIGASVFLRDHVDQLYDRTAPLDALVGQQEIDELQNILGDICELPQRLLALERFLSTRIFTPNQLPPQRALGQIEIAAEMIRRSDGRASITAIAHRVGMSQSALERHFRAAVGVTPKKMSRLTRLQHVCRLWSAGKALTEIAFEAGYTDQPHLVRDFQLFTGTSPEKFFRDAPALNLPIFYK